MVTLGYLVEEKTGGLDSYTSPSRCASQMKSVEENLKEQDGLIVVTTRELVIFPLSLPCSNISWLIISMPLTPLYGYRLTRCLHTNEFGEKSKLA